MLNSCILSVADPGFPVGRRGADLQHGHFSVKTWKGKNWVPLGVRPAPTPDPPLTIQQQYVAM